MPSPEEHSAHDYQGLTVEVSSFYERLCFARDNADPDAELEAEGKMNASLDELSDTIKALGRTAL